MSTVSKIRIRKELIGTVKSAKMDKTIVVEAQRRVLHPLFEKVVIRKNKFTAHDESNATKEGDLVRIRQSRPLSKTKRWVLIETLRENKLHPDRMDFDTKVEKKADASAKASNTKKTKKKSAGKKK